MNPTDPTTLNPELTELTALVPVAEVTLLEDRAMVVRRGTLELAPGRTRVTITGVAPVLVDKTLAAAVRPVGGGSPESSNSAPARVLDVGIERRLVTTEAERTAPLAEVEALRRAKQAELRVVHSALERARASYASIAEIQSLSVAELNEDVAWGQAPVDAWTEQFDALDARAQALALEAEEHRHQIATLERELSDLDTRVAAHHTLESVARAELRIDLQNPGETAARVELRVDYLVPGALWRPWHSARLIEPEDPESDAGARIEFRCDAAVWQATGEDWTDAALRFSTERPSLGVTPPRLTTDLLRMRKRSATVEVEVREQKINTAGLRHDDDDDDADEGSAPKQVAKDELPGIDDGGEALELRGRNPATVPADGRPHRVPLFSFEAPAQTALICTPELDRAVILRSRQANAGEHPLLAGPVDLIRNSGLVGRSSLLYVAPGERFELGWGPDSSLRVHRELELRDVERKMMSSWTRKPRRLALKLSNLGAAAKSIEIKERLPVSEVEKVEVEVTDSSQGAKPDSDGFVTWEVRLKGFGHEQLELDWVLVVHDDVQGL